MITGTESLIFDFIVSIIDSNENPSSINFLANIAKNPVPIEIFFESNTSTCTSSTWSFASINALYIPLSFEEMEIQIILSNPLFFISFNLLTISPRDGMDVFGTSLSIFSYIYFGSTV